MNEKVRRISVDIGGLCGRVFLKEARQRQDEQFLVVDPKAGPPHAETRIPLNLTYIKGRVERSGGGLPLEDACADGVRIEQVFDSVDLGLWRSLFEEASRILSSGGKLEIIDLLRNGKEIEWSLPEYGFSQIKTRVLKEREGSEMTKTLARHVRHYSRPVRITAEKI